MFRYFRLKKRIEKKSKAVAAAVRSATTARDSIPALIACFPKTGASPSMTAEATAIGTPRFFGTDGFKGMSLSVSDDDHTDKQDAPVVEPRLPSTFLQWARKLRLIWAPG
jgi:hypothetical protein